MASMVTESSGQPLVFAARSDTGLARAVNEDAHAEVAVRGGTLFIVADGMGGHRAGDRASRLAVETLVARFGAADGRGEPAARLHAALGAAHEAITAQQDGKTGRERMGTTAVALFIRDGMAHYAWIGDSRIYLVRDGELSRITDDHTVERELERKGVLDAIRSDFVVEGHRLSRALGVPGQCEPECGQPLALESGDLLLLCSDGLYRFVPSADILSVLLGADPQVATERLVELANAAGGRDNITVQVIQIGSRDDAVEAAARGGQIGSLTMELQSLITADSDGDGGAPSPAPSTAHLSPAGATPPAMPAAATDAAAEAAPDAAAEAAPDAAPDAAPGAVREAAPGAAPGAAPDAVPDAALQRRVRMLLIAFGVTAGLTALLAVAVTVLLAMLVLGR